MTGDASLQGDRYTGKLGPREKVAGTLGAGACVAAAMALCAPQIMHWEGKRNVTYLDIVKVPTACYGHTGADVGKVGTSWTDGQCSAMLDKDVRRHMDGALTCAPGLAVRPNQLAAVTVFTFNLGVGAFCRSTAARRFNVNDWKGGCNALAPYFTVRKANGKVVTKRGYITAGGRVVQGLVNRRRAEQAICLRGL